jgi:hypothetical protein
MGLKGHLFASEEKIQQSATAGLFTRRGPPEVLPAMAGTLE